MKFQNQAVNERSSRQSRRDSKNDLFWCLTLACVLVLLGSALVRVWNLADSKVATFTRTPPDQLQADARTLVAMLHYLAEPESGVATPIASNEAFDDNTALARQPLCRGPKSGVCCCLSNQSELSPRSFTNRPAHT